MSQENVELLRRGMEEANRVGINEVNPRLYYHPDVEYLPIRSATEGKYRGIAGIERFNADINRAAALFGESVSRVIVSAPPASVATVLGRANAAGVPACVIGRIGGTVLRIDVAGEKAIDIAVAEAERMWSSAIERHFIRKVA